MALVHIVISLFTFLLVNSSFLFMYICTLVLKNSFSLKWFMSIYPFSVLFFLERYFWAFLAFFDRTVERDCGNDSTDRYG